MRRRRQRLRREGHTATLFHRGFLQLTGRRNKTSHPIPGRSMGVRGPMRLCGRSQRTGNSRRQGTWMLGPAGTGRARLTSQRPVPRRGRGGRLGLNRTKGRRGCAPGDPQGRLVEAGRQTGTVQEAVVRLGDRLGDQEVVEMETVETRKALWQEVLSGKHQYRPNQTFHTPRADQSNPKSSLSRRQGASAR